MPPAPDHAGAGAEAGAIGNAEAEAETAASWRALGTLVQLVVTEPSCLPAARSLLEADLAEVDLACSRFRADSEICALQITGQTNGPTTGQINGPAKASRSARFSPRPSRSRCGRPNSPTATSTRRSARPCPR